MDTGSQWTSITHDLQSLRDLVNLLNTIKELVSEKILSRRVVHIDFKHRFVSFLSRKDFQRQCSVDEQTSTMLTKTGETCNLSICYFFGQIICIPYIYLS